MRNNILTEYSEKAQEFITAKDIEDIFEDLRIKNGGTLNGIVSLSVDVDEEGYLGYTFKTIPFGRIRRITGYLVGTLDRFNDAKRKEVEERVKHLKGKE